MANTIRDRFERLAPDAAATMARFPFAVLLTVLATGVFLVIINEYVPRGDEFWPRLGAGLGTAAVLALAGKLFAESIPGARIATMLLRFGVPILAVSAWQITSTQWLFPLALPIVALLWLSVAPVLGGGLADRRTQDRFWWVNHRAITTGIVAGAGLLIIALGLVAIERSLELLFGIETRDLMFRWVLPIAVFLLAPVYWLSTIPRLADFDASDLTQPDFLTRSIGFLGQFVLTPLLLIYAAILIAYGIQIAVTQRFPVGVLGWLVLVFVITGAANWLVLHPAFVRDRPLVRLFRRFWFWLTLVPLALYTMAVWIRIDAYGLTDERVVLIAGGLWAMLLALAFLVPRFGDIRLIPGLAAAILLIFSVGPWNFEALPRADQLGRLKSALESAQYASPDQAEWTGEAAARTRSAMRYLARSKEGRAALDELAAGFGVEMPADPTAVGAYEEVFAVPRDPDAPVPFERRRAVRDGGEIDLAATPVYLGQVTVVDGATETLAGLELGLQDGALTVGASDAETVSLDLGGWLAGQGRTTLDDPVIVFEYAGRDYALVVEAAAVNDRPTAEGPRTEFLVHIAGTLMAAPAP